MAKFTGGTTPIDLLNFDADLEDIGDGTLANNIATQFRLADGIPADADYTDFVVTKFTYDPTEATTLDDVTGGTITRIVNVDQQTLWDLSNLSLSVAQFQDLVTKDDQIFLA